MLELIRVYPSPEDSVVHGVFHWAGIYEAWDRLDTDYTMGHMIN